MKLAKFIFGALLIFLIANIITWFFVGREKALFQSLNLNENYDFVLATDSIYVLSDPNSFFRDYHTERKVSYLNTFSEKTRNEFLRRLKKQSEKSDIFYFDSNSDQRVKWGNSVLLVSISNGTPFFMSYHVIIMEGAYQLNYKQNHIWLFHWIPIGEPRIAET
jgi:hypothetical protein